MDTKLVHLRQNLDSIIKFLTPLLPLANCHMVEFFTQSHWTNGLPSNLRIYLDSLDLDEAVNKFWDSTENHNYENEISNWVHNTRSHCLAVNNDYCLSLKGLQELIKSRGCDIHPDIKITKFMTNKKSYEVQTMSPYVASLHKVSGTTHCVEAGGGRGHLLVALSLGYKIPSLTVDCDEKTLKNAEKRVKMIQKQWHAIAKKVHKNSEENVCGLTNSDLHKFARTFITKDTDLSRVVQDQFNCDHTKLLLTGLHTCGNLGPDSLRIFAANPDVTALFNVPCCYHLLTEEVDDGLFDVFQRDYGGVMNGYGFPMSEHLKGFNLGRNARMLASQSLARVTALRQLPDTSLLYRALFQALIKKHLPHVNVADGKLKGITCQNFHEYFKIADAILKTGLDSCQDLPEIKNVDCEWKKVVLFYLVRLCLAQVVESVILMDRLLFLYESGFNNVFLVKLFDPVLSPRCHSIVAIK